MSDRVYILPIAPYAHSSTLVNIELARFPRDFTPTARIRRALDRLFAEGRDVVFPSHFLTCPQRRELQEILAPVRDRVRIQIQLGTEFARHQAVVRELSRQGFGFDLLLDRSPSPDDWEAAASAFAAPPRIVYLENRGTPFFKSSFPAGAEPSFLWFMAKRRSGDLLFGEEIARKNPTGLRVYSCVWLSPDGAVLPPEKPASDFLPVRMSARFVLWAAGSPQARRLLPLYRDLLKVGIWGKIYWFLRYQFGKARG